MKIHGKEKLQLRQDELFCIFCITYFRYSKVMNSAITLFQKFEFDAVIVATNAPGRSAFNRVERRMAPLSKELCGVILPADKYGSHLDSKGNTIDIVKEKTNFMFAGQTLSEIWSNVQLDGHDTIATYIDPDLSVDDPPAFSMEYKDRHVRESHYMFQVSNFDIDFKS